MGSGLNWPRNLVERVEVLLGGSVRRRNKHRTSGAAMPTPRIADSLPLLMVFFLSLLTGQVVAQDTDFAKHFVKAFGGVCRTNGDCRAHEVCETSVRPYPACVSRPAEGITTDCTLPRSGQRACTMTLTGTIRQEWVTPIAQVLSGPDNVDIYLDSEGGDVVAAMEIGRELRQRRSRVYVIRQTICASACVLIMAGAVDRIVEPEGHVIIHRPYLNATELIGYQLAQTNFETTRDVVRQYLDSMNVPTDLWDAMTAIPPESGRRLSQGELTHFGLNRRDPAYEEHLNSTLASKYGLSMQEYLQKKAAIEECARRNGSYVDCPLMSEQSR